MNDCSVPLPTVHFLTLRTFRGAMAPIHVGGKERYYCIRSQGQDESLDLQLTQHPCLG